MTEFHNAGTVCECTVRKPKVKQDAENCGDFYRFLTVDCEPLQCDLRIRADSARRICTFLCPRRITRFARNIALFSCR